MNVFIKVTKKIQVEEGVIITDYLKLSVWTMDPPIHIRHLGHQDPSCAVDFVIIMMTNNKYLLFLATNLGIMYKYIIV